jgi:tetratricopeptide (TPR) repeat protein
MVCSLRQTAFWRDSQSIWTRTLGCTQQNSLAYNGLGMALVKDKHADEVAAAKAAATASKTPDVSKRGQDDHILAAVQQERLKRYAAAIACYRKAIDIEPGLFYVHANLADALVACGQFNDAAAEYRAALKLRENYAPAHNNLANILLRQGRADEALGEYRRALELNSRYARAHNNIAIIMINRGKVDAAIAELRAAIDIEPGFIAARENLAKLLTQQGRTAEAASQWRELSRLQSGNLAASAPSRAHAGSERRRP